jgi:alpha-1,2-mannosyltransferase
MLLGSALLVWAYYWYEWRTFQGFVNAVDHHPQFMQDFVGFYYPMGRQLLQNPTPFGGYYYSSFFAVLLVPFGAMTLSSAMTAWTIVQIACIVGLWLAAARGLLKLSPVGTVLLLVLFALSYPVLNNLKWGQVSVLLTACTVGAVAASDRRKSVLAGVLLAFAAAIKFYPALFLIWFVARRDVKACVSFAAAFTVFYMLVPVSVLGWSHWFEFERAILDMLGRSGLAARDTNSQYVEHVVMRWLAATGSNHELLALGLRGLGYLVGAVSVGLAWFLMRRAPRQAAALSMAALFVSIPFVVKTSWPHYLAYLPVCQAVLLLAAQPDDVNWPGWRRARLSFTWLSLLVSSTILLNWLPGWEVYNSSGMLFVANFLVFLAVSATAVPLARSGALVALEQSLPKVGKS